MSVDIVPAILDGNFDVRLFGDGGWMTVWSGPRLGAENMARALKVTLGLSLD